MKSVSISIAMATYNGGSFVKAQLDSFASQLLRPDELVVTDDGSTDETVDVIRQFARTAPFPVRLEINPVNLGYAQNFNRAMSLCSGDLIFLSDQDDVWLDTKIAQIVRLAQDNPRLGCFMNDAILTDAVLHSAGMTKWGQIRAAGMPDSAFVMGCCAAFRRPLMDLLLPIPSGSRSHDNWLIELAEMLGLVLRTREPLQLYRRHETNASDFHVNNLKRLSGTERVKVRTQELWRRMRSSSGMVAELDFSEKALQRLSACSELSTALAGAEATQATKAELLRKTEILKRRLAIHTRPQLLRIQEVVQLWRQGVYQNGSGALGALKDCLIRTQTSEIPRA